MARGWMGLVLIVSGLGLAGSALAQPPAPMSGTMPAPAPFGPPPSGPPVPIPLGAPPLGQPPGGPPCPAPCPPEPACPPDEACCDPGTNVSIGVDYLLWFHKRADMPALATTGSFLDPIPGALGQRNTHIA